VLEEEDEVIDDEVEFANDGKDELDVNKQPFMRLDQNQAKPFYTFRTSNLFVKWSSFCRNFCQEID